MAFCKMSSCVAIRYGIISGLAIVALQLGLYFFAKEWLVSPWAYYSTFPIHLLAMIAAGLAFRRQHGDRAGFREVLREAFISFLMGMLLYYALYYPLFSMDEGLIALQKEQAREQILWVMERKIVAAEQGEAMLEGWETRDFRLGLGGVLSGMAIHTIGGFILSALAAWMVRR